MNGGEVSSGPSEWKENHMTAAGSKWERERRVLIRSGVQDGLGHFRGKEHRKEQADTRANASWN